MYLTTITVLLAYDEQNKNGKQLRDVFMDVIADTLASNGHIEDVIFEVRDGGTCEMTLVELDHAISGRGYLTPRFVALDKREKCDDQNPSTVPEQHDQPAIEQSE